MRNVIAVCLSLAVLFSAAVPCRADDWSRDERTVLRSLWLGSLAPLPPDPSNRVADDPAAADFGHRLFFDKRLSANGNVACATCHVPALAFTDGRRTSQGIGVTERNAQTIVGAAYSRWSFWDGRKDSLWSQALAPLESPVEHGTTRAQIVEIVRGDADYRRRYVQLFGSLPTPGDADGISRAFANLGKAIAAYERELMPGASKFDRYVAAVLAGREPAAADRLTLDEELGLRVFIAGNQGQCLRCHSGPLFTDNKFHNTGIPASVSGDGAQGRLAAIDKVMADAFGCGKAYSDAPAAGCDHLRGLKRESAQQAGAFRTPTLRNLPKTAPYMHTGAFDSLDDVLWHYRQRPDARIGKSELPMLTLTQAEFEQVAIFLRTLDGPINAPAKYLRPPEPE